MAKSGKVSPSLPLRVASYLKSNENEYLPWTTFFNSLIHLKKILKTTELLDSLDNYLLDIVKPIYYKLTWNNNSQESYLTKY